MLTNKLSGKLLAASVFATTLSIASVAFAYGDSPEHSRVLQGGVATPVASVGQYVDDATITAKVKADLLSDSQLKATSVSVQTNSGAVQLTGTVSSTDQKNEAERVANRVDGVRSVQDLLQIKNTSATQEQ